MTKCLARWLESQELYCQLEANHPAEHHAKYKHEGEDEWSGEIWWWNPSANPLRNESPSTVAHSVAIAQDNVTSALIAAKTSNRTSSTKRSPARKSEEGKSNS